MATETTTKSKKGLKTKKKSSNGASAKFPTIPFHLILVDDEANARKTVDGIEELAADIRENGLLEPPGIKIIQDPELTGEQLEAMGLEESPSYVGQLTYGYRRYYALQVIRDEDEDAFSEVPYVPDEGNDLDSVFKNLNENIARKDLLPGELADAFYKLHVTLKVSLDDMARRIPMYSKPYIQGLISLRKRLTQEAWEKFHAGELTYDVARDIAKTGSSDKQKEVLKAALKASEGQGKKKKKRGVKAAAKAAAKKAKGQSEASPRPGLRDVRKKFKTFSEKGEDRPYNKGVIYALAWVLGERKSLPGLKPPKAK